jgi:hypothetical protein
LKQTIAITAGLLVLGLATAGDALAQAAPVYPAATQLPPYEIVAIVRSTGLEPVSRPVWRGQVYALHAVDPAGHPVRVTVDSRLGRIMSVTPAAHPRFAAPALPPPPTARNRHPPRRRPKRKRRRRALSQRRPRRWSSSTNSRASP